MSVSVSISNALRVPEAPTPKRSPASENELNTPVVSDKSGIVGPVLLYWR